MKFADSVLSAAGAPLALIGAALASPVAAASADGVWARDDGLVRSCMGPCCAAVCAVNVWVKDPAGSEKVGDRLVMTMKETGAGHWLSIRNET
jgi:uncharacterized protein (DUF2147 family)